MGRQKEGGNWRHVKFPPRKENNHEPGRQKKAEVHQRVSRESETRKNTVEAKQKGRGGGEEGRFPEEKLPPRAKRRPILEGPYKNSDSRKRGERMSKDDQGKAEGGLGAKSNERGVYQSKKNCSYFPMCVEVQGGKQEPFDKAIKEALKGNGKNRGH